MRKPFSKNINLINIKVAHGGSGRRQLLLSKPDPISSQMEAMTKDYLEPNGIFDWHEHTDIDEFFLVTQGTGVIKFENGTKFDYSKDDLIYIPSNTKHRIENTWEIENEFIFIRISQQYMEQKVLVLAYPGSGKTYLADHYKNVSDFEFQHYRYDYGEYRHLPLEQLKGRTEIRTSNPDWPNNFFKALDIELQKGKIVLVPFATSLLNKLNYLESSTSVRIILAIQAKESLEKMLQCFRNRGNTEEFIKRRKNDFYKCHEIIAQSKFEKVYINKNEYLSDALLKIGIKLEKGKGTKNYI